MERGEDYDQAAYERALTDAVADVVRRQAEAGIDVVDDGEMGKPSWITYLYERTSGIEPRMVDTEGGRVYPPSRDRIAFPDFYVGHDRQQAEEIFEVMGMVMPEEPDGDSPQLTKKYFVTAPLEYDNSALQRDIANFKQTLEGVEVVDAFMPVVAPASAYWLENEHYANEEEFVFALADVLHQEYRGIVDAGFLLQVDDAVLLHEYDSILSLGGAVEDYRRWAELRVEALNHALSGLPEDRVRYHVCFGSWHGPHVFDPPLHEVIDLVLKVNAALLPDRDGEPAPRARVAAVGGRQAARGEGARPRRRHAPHERGRASGARRRPDRAARQRRRPRERDGRHRLRLRPGRVPPARAPDDPVGEAPGARGGGENRDETALRR